MSSFDSFVVVCCPEISDLEIGWDQLSILIYAQVSRIMYTDIYPRLFRHENYRSYTVSANLSSVQIEDCRIFPCPLTSVLYHASSHSIIKRLCSLLISAVDSRSLKKVADTAANDNLQQDCIIGLYETTDSTQAHHLISSMKLSDISYRNLVGKMSDGILMVHMAR